MASAEWLPFCFDLNLLIIRTNIRLLYQWVRINKTLRRLESTTLAWDFRKPVGVGYTNPISPAPLFPDFLQNFKPLTTYWLSPSYSTSATTAYQIWIWFKVSNRYFCKIENFTNGEPTKSSSQWLECVYMCVCLKIERQNQPKFLSVCWISSYLLVELLLKDPFFHTIRSSKIYVLYIKYLIFYIFYSRDV